MRAAANARIYFPWLELSPAILRGFFSKKRNGPRRDLSFPTIVSGTYWGSEARIGTAKIPLSVKTRSEPAGLLLCQSLEDAAYFLI